MTSHSAFGRALPALKLTSHDPRVVQVFTTPPANLARADFGFKTHLAPALVAAKQHRAGALRYVQVKEQDSRLGTGLNWKEREREVLVLKQWAESHTPVIRDDFVFGERESTPLTVSRFDRTSRQRSPTATQSAATGKTKQLPTPPNYLLYSEKQFEGLLNLIRSHRQHYKETRVMEKAMDQRSAKFRAAQRNYKELVEKSEYASAAVEQASLPDPPKIEDFPLEVELEAIRNASLNSEVTDVELDPLDMFNMARSTYNYFVSKYILNLLADLNLNSRNSTKMPAYTSVSGSTLAYARRRLHALGGLQYSQPDEIFSHSLAPPVPGRIVEQSDNTKRYAKKGANAPFGRYYVLVGSQVHLLRPGRSGNMQLLPMDRTGEHPNQGVGLFRPDIAARLRLSDDSLDTLPSSRRWGGPGDGAWTADMQGLGLGYLEMPLRAISPRGDGSFTERVELVGEETARSETIPGARGWVGKDEVYTPTVTLTNPFTTPLSRYGLISGLGSNSASAGPGALFTDTSSSGAAAGQSKVKFSRGGFRRNNPDQGASDDGNPPGGSGDSTSGKRWLGISESLFG